MSTDLGVHGPADLLNGSGAAAPRALVPSPVVDAGIGDLAGAMKEVSA